MVTASAWRRGRPKTDCLARERVSRSSLLYVSHRFTRSAITDARVQSVLTRRHFRDDEPGIQRVGVNHFPFHLRSREEGGQAPDVRALLLLAPEVDRVQVPRTVVAQKAIHTVDAQKHLDHPPKARAECRHAPFG